MSRFANAQRELRRNDRADMTHLGSERGTGMPWVATFALYNNIDN